MEKTLIRKSNFYNSWITQDFCTEVESHFCNNQAVRRDQPRPQSRQATDFCRANKNSALTKSFDRLIWSFSWVLVESRRDRRRLADDESLCWWSPPRGLTTGGERDSDLDLGSLGCFACASRAFRSAISWKTFNGTELLRVPYVGATGQNWCLKNCTATVT